MKTFLIMITLLAGVLLFSGCSQKKMTRTGPQQPAAEQQDVMAPKAEEPQADTAAVRQQVPASRTDTADGPSQARQEKVFEAKDIHFDYDRYDITPETRAVLQETASWLLKNRNLEVSIEGHCDERGTNEYNLALGDRRANSVMKFLTANGVSGNRIRTVSYGEERPLCTDHYDACWQKNRRAHFVLN
ncbi:MAG: peptidoglycan-associated lipoprotein Pal [Nitrospirota bacterium]